MKAHYFEPKEPISIIVFLKTFKLACVTNKIHEGAAMSLLPNHVHETLTNALSSPMCVEDRAAPIIVSLRNNDKRLRKLLRSYPGVVIYLLKKYATNQEIAEYDAASLHYMQPTHMTPQQYACDSVAKSCKVVDV